MKRGRVRPTLLDLAGKHWSRGLVKQLQKLVRLRLLRAILALLCVLAVSSSSLFFVFRSTATVQCCSSTVNDRSDSWEKTGGV